MGGPGTHRLGQNVRHITPLGSKTVVGKIVIGKVTKSVDGKEQELTVVCLIFRRLILSDCGHVTCCCGVVTYH